MKYGYIVAILMLVSISACSTKLNPEDRALLMDTQNLARQAVAQSSEAMTQAKAAREFAERAMIEAQASGQKADRIFRASQQK